MIELTNQNYLKRIESLGDNCELGFVLRKAGFEKGGLFRWTVTPVDKLIQFMDEPTQELFCFDDLVPYGPGMVLDERSGFSFHSKMRSEKGAEGKLRYIASESERSEIYEKERSKIDYLKQGFLQRLNAESGSIYLIKANKGIHKDKVIRLASQIQSYSAKHVLVEIKSEADNAQTNRLVDQGTYFTASITRFAPYVAANDVCYSEWDDLILQLMQNDEINARIDAHSQAA